MCSGLAKLWEQGSQQRQLQLRIPGLKPRTHIAAGPLAWAAGEAVKRAVGHAPREVMVSFAWLAASLRSCQGEMVRARWCGRLA